MFITDRFSLSTIALAIALTMGGCAAPANDHEPTSPPAGEEAATTETGAVSSAMWGAPIGFGGCEGGFGVAPAVGWGGAGWDGAGWGGGGWGWGGGGWGGLGWGGAGWEGAGWDGLGWGGGGWGGCGFAPAIGFRGDEAAAEEGAAEE